MSDASPPPPPRSANGAPRKPDGRFDNTEPGFEPRGLAEVLRWRWNATREGLPRPPTTPIPAVAPDLDFVHANARAGAAMVPAVTWIGHATVLVQAGGVNMLTDPIFGERASPLPFAGPRRHQAPGIALRDLPHIDLFVVSHNHYDHLDASTVDALARQDGGPPRFAAPLGLLKWFESRGVSSAVELDWWQSTHVDGPRGPVEAMLVPARHWSARGLGDRLRTLWGGFALLADDAHVFFAGDTAYSRDFVDIRERLAARHAPSAGGGFDLALLPIGAYEPRWFMQNQHVNVEEALRIHADLGAKRTLGVHWGTFELTDESLDEPPRELARRLAASGLTDDDVFTLAIGETRRLVPRRAPGGGA